VFEKASFLIQIKSSFHIQTYRNGLIDATHSAPMNVEVELPTESGFVSDASLLLVEKLLARMGHFGRYQRIGDSKLFFSEIANHFMKKILFVQVLWINWVELLPSYLELFKMVNSLEPQSPVQLIKEIQKQFMTKMEKWS